MSAHDANMLHLMQQILAELKAIKDRMNADRACGFRPAPLLRAVPMPEYDDLSGRGIPLPGDCGCPADSVCLNVACPRAIRVTC